MTVKKLIVKNIVCLSQKEFDNLLNAPKVDFWCYDKRQYEFSDNSSEQSFTFVFFSFLQ